MAAKNIVVAIAGASGSAFAKRALLHLFSRDVSVHLIISGTGREIYKYEVEESIEDTIKAGKNVITYDNDDLFAPIADDCLNISGMIILLCSISTASKIAWGIEDTLINKTAAYCIKEKIPMVMSPRESPINCTVLDNLLVLKESGVFIMPPVPSLYDESKDFNEVLDDMVGKMLGKIGLDYT